MGFFNRNPFAAAPPEGQPATPTRDEIAAEYERRGASLYTAREAATAIQRPAESRSDSDHRALRRNAAEIDAAARKRLGGS